MAFDWNDQKSQACFRERAFDFEFAARVFDGVTAEFVDNRKDYGETRIIAFGSIDDRSIAVVYTQRGEVRWIISAFPVRGKELLRWQRRAAEGRSARAGSTRPGSTP